MDAGEKTQLAARLLGGECCVLSRKVFCDGPIPRPEESYRIVFVCLCVCVCVTECDQLLQ